MKLVIDIEDYDREYIVNDGYHIPDTINWKIAKAVINGTPLPEHHGRLIDADALPLNAIDDANYGSNYIRIAPTIIEGSESE